MLVAYSPLSLATLRMLHYRAHWPRPSICIMYGCGTARGTTLFARFGPITLRPKPPKIDFWPTLSLYAMWFCALVFPLSCRFSTTTRARWAVPRCRTAAIHQPDEYAACVPLAPTPVSRCLIRNASRTVEVAVCASLTKSGQTRALRTPNWYELHAQTFLG